VSHTNLPVPPMTPERKAWLLEQAALLEPYLVGDELRDSETHLLVALSVLNALEKRVMDKDPDIFYKDIVLYHYIYRIRYMLEMAL